MFNESFFELVGKRIKEGRCGIYLCVCRENEFEEITQVGKCEICPVKECAKDVYWSRKEINRLIRKWYRTTKMEMDKVKHLENLT
jgi:hypothetical protein